MGLTNYQKYEVLKLRADGVPYEKIGAMFNISNKRVSDVATKVRTSVKVGNYFYINAIANAAKVPNTDVVRLSRYHIRELKPKTPLVIQIKINDSISKKNIWYASKKGRVFNAKRKYGYYIIENNQLFKINERDCSELPIKKQSA